MRIKGKILFLLLTGTALQAENITPAENPLINASFNNISDGLLENFQLISNGIGSPTWDNAIGQARLNANANSSGTTGTISSNSIDGTAHSEISASFTINSIVDPDGEPTNNGHWIGLTGTNAQLWNNSESAGAVNGWAVGIRFFNGSLHFIYDNVSGNEVDIESLGTYTLASLQDGYTVDFKFTTSGWEICLTGLTGTTDAQGTWPAGFDYSFIENDSSVYPSLAYQQANEAGTIINVSSISVNGDGTPGSGDPDSEIPTFTPFVDTDGDSYHDHAELSFGSDPEDPSSIPDHRTNVKPNVVIIYADDLGFGELSAYASLYNTVPVVSTPHMDSLVSEGVTFTQGHSGNAVCTPSRYALLTGKYNWREFNGITNNWGGTINGDELPRASDVTIAEYLQTEQYDTAAIGKWHLGGAFYQTNGNRVPNNSGSTFNNGSGAGSGIDWERRVDFHATDNGFDYFRGNAAAINFAPYVYMADDRMQYWDSSLNNGQGAYRPALNTDTFRFWTTTAINNQVLGDTGSRNGLGDPSYNQVDVGLQIVKDVEEYLTDRATTQDTDPFFLYVSMHSPHRPWAVSPDYVTADTTQNNYVYRDWMREVDGRVGSFLAAIEDNGFKDNTIVIFTSDNGPETNEMFDAIARGADPNGPLRGNKRDAWDGGTRVPFIVRWPGQAAQGLTVDHPIWQGDIFATMAAVLGSELPDSIAPDGESFLNLLRGQRKPQPERPAFVMSSIGGHLGLKTTDGWKFIDSTGGGGNNTSWNSSNIRINNPIGTDRGRPKQLFNQSIDLGENMNLIASITTNANIRQASENIAGRDLLGLLDQIRANESTALFPRIPDNDGDSIPNSYEIANGFDPNWPLDANEDNDADGSSNLTEFIAGTDPNDGTDFLYITDFSKNGNLINIEWPTKANRNYVVEASLDLSFWVEVSRISGTGASVPVSFNLEDIEIDGVSSENAEKLFLRVIISNTAE